MTVAATAPPTGVDVAHRGLLEQGVDQQHVVVGRLGLQLLYLRRCLVKVSLERRARKIDRIMWHNVSTANCWKSENYVCGLINWHIILIHRTQVGF